jgi:vacuolar-type H+-ATPase subunit F/Vma7
MKVMIIGHPQAVLGFSLVGVQGLAAIIAAEVNEALDKADRRCGWVDQSENGPAQAAQYYPAGG